MAKRKKTRKKRQVRGPAAGVRRSQKKPLTKSLLDVMEDGREYESAVGYRVELDVSSELRRAIAEIEAARERPLLCYLANVVKPEGLQTSITPRDELPIYELVDTIPADVSEIDVLIVTPGGLAQQVTRFVDKIRGRFANVGFILPDRAMSAGTLWAISGNEIWMRPQASMGPIDPQVHDRHGRLVPAQALLTFLERVQEQGDEALAQGQDPPWVWVRLLDQMEAREIGNTLSLSQYSINIAKEYLARYKFRDWAQRGDGTAVTPEMRSDRAAEVARDLCDHTRWKVHGHALSRETLWDELKILIRHTEEKPELDRAVRRFWALVYWLFENSRLSKVFLSQHYGVFRSEEVGENGHDDE